MNRLTYCLSDPIRLVVDFDRPFRELVESANYWSVSENVYSADFSTTRTGIVDTSVRLLSFNRKVGIDGLLRKMEKLHLPGADPRLMIQLSVDQPEIETHSQIVAPGVIIRQTGKFCGRRLLSFWIGGGKRHLGFGRWGKESWLANTKFLVESQ